MSPGVVCLINKGDWFTELLVSTILKVYFSCNFYIRMH